jgi:hydroxyacylglutathione hydrolase
MTTPRTLDLSSFKLHIIPALSDNYTYLLERHGHALAVDPSDHRPLLDQLSRHHLDLTGILITHGHADHIAGCPPLAKHFQCAVYGPADADIPALDHPVNDGQHITWQDLSMTVLTTPGHSRHDICWHLPQEQLLFTGDTLFAGGCGRVFSGQYSRMWQSLERLAALPPQTRICCGHEYTLDNLTFAATIDPDNAELRQRIEETKRLMKGKLPTVPSLLRIELQTNPFLRCNQTAIKAALKLEKDTPPEMVFTALRQKKNHF